MYRGDIQEGYPDVFSLDSEFFSRAKTMIYLLFGILLMSLLDYCGVFNAGDIIILIQSIVVTVMEWWSTYV